MEFRNIKIYFLKKNDLESSPDVKYKKLVNN